MEPSQTRSDFRTLPEQPNFNDFELDVLDYWQKIDAFKTQLEKTKDLPRYTFYDGPPFATGTPHYGHICAGTIKDVVTRYATQTGHYVERRFGWDCHGLPIEHEIDKEHNVKTRQDVLDVGVSTYNKWCKEIVMKYEKEWRKVVNRMGRWIDFDNDYKTMDLTFMESVWWVFKQMWNKGLVYRGSKVMPYSTGCSTVLSNFEAGQNFKDVKDPSVYVSFPLVEDPTVKLVAWTTTPWTLPSNLALCVNADFEYVKVKDKKTSEVYILAKCRLGDLYKKAELYEVLDTFKGSALEGKEYKPLFDYFLSYRETGAFRVLLGSHVTSDAGTGVVHTAPGFGADDFKICVDDKYKIVRPDNPPVPIDANGFFTAPVNDFLGKYIKDPETEKGILHAIKEKKRLVASGEMPHSYPYCYRSDTPLIYRAVNSWFINVKAIKQDLLVNNKKAYWVPAFAQEKRFNNWLENAEDWCFSRNRFWGNPIPIWVSDDLEEQVCIGSIEELKQLSGVQDITDLHTDSLDKITIPSKKGKGVLKRIEEVFDCWFESGSMPFAQCHYPFSVSEEEFGKRYPADFIGEGLDQTRGWFYTLNVIATAVTNQNPYKNVIVNGLVLAEDGKKMSKREKNYTDPMEIVKERGADAVRLYLMNSQLVRAEPLCFKDPEVKLVVKNTLIPWYSVCRLLIQSIRRWEAGSNYADKFSFNEKLVSAKSGLNNVMDHWIVAGSQNLIKFVREEMDAYRLYTVVPKLLDFLDVLTHVYLKLNKSRLKGDEGRDEQRACLDVLFGVLLNITVLMAPFAPFITEVIYQLLVSYIPKDSSYYEQSVHFLRIPKFDPSLIDEKIERDVKVMIKIFEDARLLRKKVSGRQPIKSITLITDSDEHYQSLKPFLGYIQEELNVHEVLFEKDISKYVLYQLVPDHRALGAKFQKAYNNEFRKTLQGLTDVDAQRFLKENKLTVNGHDLTSEFLSVKPILKKETLSENLELGGDGDIKVLLDLSCDEEMKRKYLTRQVIRKIQKLRKDSKLNIEDDIAIFLDYGDSSVLKAAVEANKPLTDKMVKKPLYPVSKMPGTFKLIGVDVHEEEGQGCDIYICENPFKGVDGQELPDLDQSETKRKRNAVGEVANRVKQLVKSAGAGEDEELGVVVNLKEGSKIKGSVEFFRGLLNKLVVEPLYLVDRLPEKFNVRGQEKFEHEGEEFEVILLENPNSQKKAKEGETKKPVVSAKNEEARKKTTAKDVAQAIQKLRRTAGISAEDDVVVFINFREDSKVIKPAFETNKNAMDAIVKKPFKFAESLPENFEVVAREKSTYEGEDFEVTIAKEKVTYSKELGEAVVKEVLNKVKRVKRSAGLGDKDEFAVVVNCSEDSKIVKTACEENKTKLEEAIKASLHLKAPENFSSLAKEAFKFKGEEFEVLVGKV